MAGNVIEALEALCQEKHIDRQDLLDRLEKSLERSYKEVLHLDYGAQVTIDPESGKVYVYELVPVGEPDEETGEYSRRHAGRFEPHRRHAGEGRDQADRS